MVIWEGPGMLWQEKNVIARTILIDTKSCIGNALKIEFNLFL